MDKSEARATVWSELQEIARPDSRFHLDFDEYIPDFAESEAATARLTALDIYRQSSVVLSTLFTLSSGWIPVLLSLAVGAVLLIAGAKYPRAALVGTWSAFVLTFLGNALFAKEGDLLVHFWVFSVSQASLLKGLRLGLRIAAMILPAVAFIAVTPRHEYLDAFRGLRIPPAAEILTIVLRYVDILWYEIQISMKAMSMRGVNWHGGVRERISAFRLLMLPLIFRISEHIEGQTLAIDNRGGVSARKQAPEVPIVGPAVAIRDVYVRYGDGSDGTGDHALSEVDLDFERGKTTILMGRTGAGKTSTLLLCADLIPHSVGQMRGDVEVFGWNTKKTSPAARHVQREELVVGKGLVYTYPDGPTAIDGLDITLYQGEFVVILGANGSGKTTTALLLAQAMPPDKGEILIEGVPMDFACHRGCIAYVFQEPVNQMVTMKVADELAFGPRQLGWAKEDVQRVVEREAARFGLALEKIPLHLARADARKLAIAANLTMDPQVIILDEPTNNLDESDTAQLIAYLQELQASGTTVVAITHDVELACAYADRVIVMRAGKILVEGPPREVMAHPDLLLQSDVVVPPVVSLSLALCPNQPPALTVDELAAWIQDATNP